MTANFKIFYTDPVGGRAAPSLPAGAIPLAYENEVEALDKAMKAIELGRIVWKIECPDGSIISREDIEFIHRARAMTR